MTRETITAVLESEGFKGGAKGYAIPEDRDGVCFVSAPGEVMQVGRLVKVEPHPHHVALETTKGERFFFAYEDVLGIRVSTAAAAKERGAGFSR